MAEGDETIFRKAALARLASPEQLDARLNLTPYPGRILATAALLLTLAALFAAWLLSTR
jgi:hypothetical protein